MALVPDGVVQREWDAALLDAGLDSTDVVLWTYEGFSDSRDLSACSYPAGRDFHDRRFLPAAERAGYDIEEERRPRVALFVDFYHAWRDGALLLRLS